MVEVQTHVFHASLSPKLYRDFEILSAKKLYDLAGTIVQFFEFDFDHAFGFYSKLTGRIFDSPVKYELFADLGESNARSTKRALIADAFPAVGSKMTCLYDYGDNWQFRIEVIGQNRKVRGSAIQGCSKRSGWRPNNIPAARRIRINIRSAEFDMPLDWCAQRRNR